MSGLCLQVYNLFDDIMLLSEGRIVFHGPKEEVHSHERRARFSHREPELLELLLSSLLSDPPVLSVLWQLLQRHPPSNALSLLSPGCFARLETHQRKA